MKSMLFVAATFMASLAIAQKAPISSIACARATHHSTLTAHLWKEADGSFMMSVYKCKKADNFSCLSSGYISERFPVATTDGYNFIGERGSLVLHPLGYGYTATAKTDAGGEASIGFSLKNDCGITRSH